MDLVESLPLRHHQHVLKEQEPSSCFQCYLDPFVRLCSCFTEIDKGYAANLEGSNVLQSGAKRDGVNRGGRG